MKPSNQVYECLACNKEYKTWAGVCYHLGRQHRDFLRWLVRFGMKPHWRMYLK